MWKAIIWKELRECGLYAGLALVLLIEVFGSAMDLRLFTFFGQHRGSEIPLLCQELSGREQTFTQVAVILAIIIGLHQSMWETWRQTTLFLLHRPLPRTQITLAKLTAGSGLLLSVTVIPLLIYALWAATPGTHASPFFWGFTEPWWRSVGMALTCYLAAFLTGLRPANWLGSRSWPLICGFTIALFIKYTHLPLPVIYLSDFLVMALMLVSILETTQQREYP